jgi:hypothetical protein
VPAGIITAPDSDKTLEHPHNRQDPSGRAETRTVVLAREDSGPVAAWKRQATNEAEARAEEWLTAGGVNVSALEEHVNGNGNHSANGNRADRTKRHQGLLSRKHIQTEMAARLIEAAFRLGVEAGKSRNTSSGARFLVRQQENSRAA